MTGRLTGRRLHRVGLVCAVILSLGCWVAAALQGDETRDITKDWKVKRSSNQSAAGSAKRSKPAPIYVVKSRIPKADYRAESAGDAEIGVTVWRLRPSRPGDEVRDFIQPKGEGPKEQWTAERVESDVPIAEGQRVRMSIESLRTGYLYVINRARYADGTFGNPYLIFPTQRINNGENAVKAGQVVRMPAYRDEPPYFELLRNVSSKGAKEETEELIILVTKELLRAFAAPPERQLLSAEKVDLLIKQYGSQVERSEMKGGTGKPITKIEEKAARDPAQLLTADDPYPQTIFRLAVKPGDPMLVTMRLRVVDKN